MNDLTRSSVLTSLYANRGDKDYTSPSPEIYPHCFLWDSAFSAILYARFGDPLSAVQEIEAIFKGQDKKTGFIPNMRFGIKNMWWDPERYTFTNPKFGSDYSQPPVLALAVWETYRSLVNSFDQETGVQFLQKLYPSVKSFYQYFINYRQNSKQNSLLGCIHPHETGRDSDPTFDFYKKRLPRDGWKTSRSTNLINSALDYFGTLQLNFKLRKVKWNTQKARNIFWVNDIMFNCIFVDNLQILSEIAKTIGQINDVLQFSLLAKQTEKDICERMWDKDNKRFYAINGQHTIKTVSISNLFPIILEGISQVQLESILRDMEDPDWLGTEFPFPSVPANSKAYDPEYKEKGRLWRGPVWININWYLVKRGLLRQAKLYQQVDSELSKRCFLLAKKVAEKSYEMVKKGRGEFYSPHTGKPLRLHNFAWSNLGYDLKYVVEMPGVDLLEYNNYSKEIF